MTDVAAGRRFRHVLVDDGAPVAVVTMNRPERRNALSLEHMNELIEALRAIAARADIGAVVLRGAGPAFCAGHDLGEMIDRELDDHRRLFEVCTTLMETIQGIPQPVIAEVQGIATAAGCQLVATCDLAVAADDARFATPGVRIGLFCSTPMVALSRAVGRKKALEMLLTGEPIGAEDARASGLINRVVPAARLSEETRALAEQIAAASHHVVALGKHAFYEQVEMTQEGAYAHTREVMSRNAADADGQEGMCAFLEKRRPVWRDR
ncbi:MAG TPA: enoyl-CoA hydratase [Candidatus Dormibacteraeota bacterium]|jgi:enoyl-CoA hydratase/carnithine racemase|nr:enoyl-CoA hydratase [Candidatus Dormibacteraeota bacterium]